MLNKVILNEWLNRGEIHGVLYHLNDAVIITENNLVKTGTIISLLETSPEPEYLIEMSTGKDEIHLQSKLLKSENLDFKTN